MYLYTCLCNIDIPNNILPIKLYLIIIGRNRVLKTNDNYHSHVNNQVEKK